MPEPQIAPHGLLERGKVSFRVVGIAQPKGSTRAFIPKGWSRPIITSTNPNLKDWQQSVAGAAQQHVTELFVGPVELSVWFFLPRPKSLPRNVVAHLKKPDLDKLVRAVKDALTGVAWRDDSQVVTLHAVKVYAEGHTPPCVDVRILGL